MLVFLKKCLSSIPIRTLCGLCVLQSLWAFYLGILAESPNPFPVVKGCVCFVGSASCRAFGHTRPASVPGLSVGLPPLVPVGGYAPKQGCFGCLPKVLHDAKPAEQATLDTPFLSTIEIFRQFESIFFENAMLIFSCYSLRHIFSFTQFTKYKIPCRHETVGYQSYQSIIIIFLPAALAL